MSIQIIEENRRPSTAEKFNRAFGQGMQAVGQYGQQKALSEREAKKRQAIASLAGEEVANMPEEMQKIYFKEMLQGKRGQELEGLRSSNKQEALQQKQDFLTQLLSSSGQNQAGSNNQNRTDQQGIQGFDPSTIPDEVIAKAASVDPNIARSLQHSKDVALREKRAKAEYDLKVEKASPEHKREEQLASAQASADVKYNQTLQELSKQHELKEQSLERLDKLNRKGVTGKPYEKILEKTGLVNLTSDGRREFAADVKNLITDIRSILGGQFSNFEFQTILNAYPSADFSQEANAAIIRNLKGFQDIKKKEVEYATELKKENGGKIPFDFQSQVNEKVREYAASKVNEIKNNTQKIMAEEYGITPGNILMLDPQGEPLDVPAEDVERYQSLGATLP